MKRGERVISVNKGKIPAHLEAGLKTLQAAFDAAKRIDKISPRPGSFKDLDDIHTFAAELRERVALAVCSDQLLDLDLELPNNAHLAGPLTTELKGIPDLVLFSEPTETGWRRRLVGHGICPPIQTRRP